MKEDIYTGEFSRVGSEFSVFQTKFLYQDPHGGAVIGAPLCRAEPPTPARCFR